jgi:DNA-binding transcriptional regulator YhcF (GntR family)
VLSYWWFADQMPFPSKRKIAVAIGCTEKTVQKTMARLEKLGFVTRIERRKDQDRSDSNVYDFSPLIAQLKPLAEEEIEILKAEREAKDARMVPAWKKKPKLKVVAA